MNIYNPKKVWIWTIVCFVILFILFGLVTFLSIDTNIKFASTAVALSAIGAVAIGIERVIEMIWSFMAALGKGQFPLGSAVAASQKVVNNLDGVYQPFFAKAQKILEDAKKVNDDLQGKRTQAEEELAKLQSTLVDLKTKVPFDPTFQNIANDSLKGISTIQDILHNKDLDLIVKTTNDSIYTAADFVASFQENPGRRLISIYLGMLLGLGVAWLSGLDVFQAIMGSAVEVAKSAGPHWGVALTGVLMGLGASPTHEVIQILKEIKNSRQAANAG